MCLIAYQPPGDKPFERSVLENGWDQNHHGAGYMFVDGDKLVIRKPFFKLKELLRSYHDDHRKCGTSSHFVVHFRWATHGSAKAVNIHPHVLANGDAGLVHNGILTDFLPPHSSDISDTVWFCKTVLYGRPIEQLTNVDFGGVLAEMIGTRNKLVLLDKTGQCVIVNHAEGVKAGDRWYSNDDYKKKAWSKSDWSHATPVHSPNYKPGSCSGTYLPGGNSTESTQQGIDRRLPMTYHGKTIVPSDPTGEIPPEVYAGLTEDERETVNDLYSEEYDEMYIDSREYPGWENVDWDDMDRQAWIEARRQFDEMKSELAEHAKLDAELDAEIDARKAEATPERKLILPPAELRDAPHPMN